MTTREVAAATCLQIYGGMDPDTSRSLAIRLVETVDRAGARGHTDRGPTPEEVARAVSELARQGVTVSPAKMHRALFTALVPEPFERAS